MIMAADMTVVIDMTEVIVMIDMTEIENMSKY